ncbi:MAG: hypothetical protein KGR26_16435 [Cyanobacteria bacterium REEB65]|nr:hypothetical protein [Cyanobacteria bacterium REEB65]
MKITINDAVFETPFSLSGTGVALRWLGRCLEQANEDSERTTLNIQTDADYRRAHEEFQAKYEERVLREAEAIKRRRAEVAAGIV